METKVIETNSYLNRLSKILHKGQCEDELREEIKKIISANPLKGDLIVGTGGLRKIRYPIPGKGKSGGCRVIYYFYNEKHPIYLLTVYPKNKIEDLNPQERRALTKLVQELKNIYSKTDRN